MSAPPSGYKPCPHCAQPIRETALVCRFCGHDLPDMQAPAPKKSEFTFLHLVLYSLVVSAIIAIISILMLSKPGASGTPSPTPANTPQAGQPAWVSSIDDCPTSIDYGQLIGTGATYYTTRDMLGTFGLIPHGAQVERLEELNRSHMIKVRYKGIIGYVQGIMLIGYDPAGGIKPDPAVC